MTEQHECGVEISNPSAAQGARKQILANWQTLLRVARAAKEYNDVIGTGSIDELVYLYELREALKEAKHLLEDKDG